MNTTPVTMKWTPEAERAFVGIFGDLKAAGFVVAYDVLHGMAEGTAWTRWQQGMNKDESVEVFDIALVSGLVDQIRMEQLRGEESEGDGDAGVAGTAHMAPLHVPGGPGDTGISAGDGEARAPLDAKPHSAHRGRRDRKGHRTKRGGHR